MATILLTRPEAQSGALAETLRARGWTPLLAPMLTFEALDPPPGFHALVENSAALAFTSANGVRAFAANSPRRDLPVFTVGDATEAAAREAGFSETRSAAGDAEALAGLIAGAGVTGAVLHIRGRRGGDDLSARLTAAGIGADEAVLYAMRAAEALPAPAASALAADRVDAAAFYSPRTARVFATLAQMAGLAPLSALRGVAISPAAAQPLADLGLREVVIADRPDGEAMLGAIGQPDRATS